MNLKKKLFNLLQLMYNNYLFLLEFDFSFKKKNRIKKKKQTLKCIKFFLWTFLLKKN